MDMTNRKIHRTCTWNQNHTKIPSILDVDPRRNAPHFAIAAYWLALSTQLPLVKHDAPRRNGDALMCTRYV